MLRAQAAGGVARGREPAAKERQPEAVRGMQKAPAAAVPRGPAPTQQPEALRAEAPPALASEQ